METSDQTTDRDLRHLEKRVERLEHLVVQTVAWAAGLCLVVGSFLDYIPNAAGSEETEDAMPRLIAVPFTAFGYRTDDGGADGFAVAAGIGFTGLLLCALIALWLLVVISTGTATERTGRLLGIATSLAAVGTVIAGFFALFALGSDKADVGWGVVVFAIGIALCATLLRSGLRRWWDPLYGR